MIYGALRLGANIIGGAAENKEDVFFKWSMDLRNMGGDWSRLLRPGKSKNKSKK